MYSALFLDRDGVINRRIPGEYISRPEEVEFLPDVEEGLRLLSPLFRYVFIVTNQQGIGKGVMSKEDLAVVHDFILDHLAEAGILIDAIYYCPDLKDKAGNCRKPNPAMAWQAKEDFPDLVFGKSLMVGDSLSDVLFGKKLGMKTARILTRFDEEAAWEANEVQADISCDTLVQLYHALREKG